MVDATDQFDALTSMEGITDSALTGTGIVPWHRRIADATLGLVAHVHQFEHSSSVHATIVGATTHEEIITALRFSGFEAVAERLCHLQKFAEDDPDEQPVVMESARQMALFLMHERQLRNPQIGVNPDGLAQVEWRVAERGILAMEFLPSGQVRFAAISGPVQPGVEPRRASGTLPRSETLHAVRWFAARVEP